jgi:hypothetical protein
VLPDSKLLKHGIALAITKIVGRHVLTPFIRIQRKEVFCGTIRYPCMQAGRRLFYLPPWIFEFTQRRKE